MPRKYFPFYFTFREAAQTMPPKLRATFYEAIIEYGTTGKEPTLPKSIVGYWPLVKPMLDAAKSHYDAGTNGGRPSKNDSFGFPDSETNGLHKEKEKEKDNEKVKEKREGEEQRPTAPPTAYAPMQGARGGMASLGSALDNGDRDAATEAARQKFLNSIKRPEWAAANAAPPDAVREDDKL